MTKTRPHRPGCRPSGRMRLRDLAGLAAFLLTIHLGNVTHLGHGHSTEPTGPKMGANICTVEDRWVEPLVLSTGCAR